jgi:hypothetical protein
MTTRRDACLGDDVTVLVAGDVWSGPAHGGQARRSRVEVARDPSPRSFSGYSSTQHSS